MSPILLRRESILDHLEPASNGKLEQTSGLEEIAHRMGLAQKVVSDVAAPATPEGEALQQILKQDVPMLLNEILRLRPELRRGARVA
jgi:hypothetical protein